VIGATLPRGQKKSVRPEEIEVYLGGSELSDENAQNLEADGGTVPANVGQTTI
jgi:hypothetical protein